ncbi:MAG: 5'-methylthioadenosine/adenosylhomocysteine nucleosidase [Clostridia bacterium]|nr:5'-methylthioadenosine/adenosylhomocysteine nucleosidase [Clostridia bacterium]
MIGIIGAMKIEVSAINGLMTDKKEKEIAGVTFTEGKLYGKDIVTAVCGIGKVAAAICTQAMIMEYKPECVINTGVGGSLSAKLGICDVVIAESLVQHDMDTTPIGDVPGYISGLDTVDMSADKSVSDRLFASAEMTGKTKVFKGKIASGDQFIADKSKKDFIVSVFGADVCEMEGAAIAQTCCSNSVPFGVVRAISDCADGSSHMDYTQFLPLAAENAAKIIENFVKSY